MVRGMGWGPGREKQILRLGGWNVGQGGMIDELDTCIERVKTVLEVREVDLLGVTEHWRGRQNRLAKEMKEMVG